MTEDQRAPRVQLSIRFSVIEDGNGYFLVRDHIFAQTLPGKVADRDIAQLITNKKNATLRVDSWWPLGPHTDDRYGIITDGTNFCAWDWLTNSLPDGHQPYGYVAGAKHDVDRLNGRGPSSLARSVLETFVVTGPSTEQINALHEILRAAQDGQVLFNMMTMVQKLKTVGPVRSRSVLVAEIAEDARKLWTDE